jgi:hypothetical protein
LSWKLPFELSFVHRENRAASTPIGKHCGTTSMMQQLMHLYHNYKGDIAAGCCMCLHVPNIRSIEHHAHIKPLSKTIITPFGTTNMISMGYKILLPDTHRNGSVRRIWKVRKGLCDRSTGGCRIDRATSGIAGRGKERGVYSHGSTGTREGVRT